ncbi:MAG TPA: histidine kinase [Thermoanaerobaculia bacterium]|nr:histidine kinase [Thermoanaerobaculia bacterium]
MKWQHPLDAPAERLIVAGRILFGAVALGLLWVEPIGVFRNQSILLILCAIYMGYAILTTFVGVGAQLTLPWYRTATHVADVAFAVALLWVSADVATPFRVFATFAVLAAGLRFGWRAIVATTGVVLAAFLLVAIYAGSFLNDPAFRLIHIGFGLSLFVVVAGVLAHLKSREEKVRTDLDRLASWTRSPILETREVLRDALERVTLLLEAKVTMLLWQESEEPWLHIATWADGELRWLREAPDRFEPVIADELSGTSFFTQDIRAEGEPVYYRDRDTMQVLRERAIHPDLAERLPEPGLLSVCVEGQTIEGRLFVSGAPYPGPDKLLTAEIIADLVAARLDQCHSIQHSQETAVREERIRLARDLHDGLLQSLTGVALHLKTAAHQIESNPAAAARSLEQLQDIIMSDQRELRSFIQQLRPYASAAAATRLTVRLEDLGLRFHNQFGLQVQMNTESLSPMVTDEMRYEIFALVNEALANVAKHAEARNVTVELNSDPSEIRITIRDDGKGFPFRGTYDLAQLSQMRRGPLTLKERIASLGGNLIIESRTSGSTLDIRLPR